MLHAARALMGGASRRPRAAVVLAAMAAALSGCGGSSATAGAASGGAGSSAVSSVSCVSTTAGRRVSSACTFTLSDGRRFRCPPRFASGPGVSVTRIEHAAACVRLAALVISAPLRALARRLAVVRACLGAQRMRFAGGIVLPAQRQGPAGELESASALIAFYTDAAAAAHAASSIASRVRRSGAALTRAGLENIVWTSHPPATARGRIARCLTR